MSVVLEIEKRNENTCFERTWAYGDRLVRRMLTTDNFEIAAQLLDLMAGARDRVPLPTEPPLRLIAMRVTLIENTSPTGIATLTHPGTNAAYSLRSGTLMHAVLDNSGRVEWNPTIMSTAIDPDVLLLHEEVTRRLIALQERA